MQQGVASTMKQQYRVYIVTIQLLAFFVCRGCAVVAVWLLFPSLSVTSSAVTPGDLRKPKCFHTTDLKSHCSSRNRITSVSRLLLATSYVLHFRPTTAV